MPLIGVHKLNKNENPESNPKIDQAAYLQNWTTRPAKSN
jgi:hypothetical protein